ncbi:MAG: fimbrial assembly protein FimA [Phototrophicales bacterium]|nr:MAG: fimbrial assembly protein FimA [Phototrophicales bacterium]RMG71433.1 MAG: DUF1028 domain-containing protein [Chloroflexota bacterium]
MTFSIVGYDPEEQAWGIAVASKFLAVGSVVPWAQAGVGAIATQAWANVSYGPNGLKLLAEGKTAQETLDLLLANDPEKAKRQVGIVDRYGNSAAFTGENCLDWAGHKTGQYYACQGNILTGEETVNAMVEAFLNTSGELSDRLLAALLAGDTIGGDSRGKQSAALYVVRANAGYGGDNDRYIDLRVDDDPEPVHKLKTLLATHHLFFGRSNDIEFVEIDKDIAAELQEMLHRQGYYAGKVTGEWDDMSKVAFWTMIGNENLEERWNINETPDKIDRVVLNYLRERFG